MRENSLHIGFCGPATLDALRDLVDQDIPIAGYPFRGSSTLIREYISLGHTVTLFTTSPDITRTTVISGKNLKIVAVPTRSRGYQRGFDFFSQERKALIKHIHEENPEVLHAHWTYEFGLAARQSKIPCVLTVHDWGPSVALQNKHPYWYFRWAMQVRCLLYPGILTAPSYYIADKIVKVFRRPCLVIPNGIDLASFDPRDKHLDAVEFRVGMLNVGFSSRKNVQGALRAWSSIKDVHPSAIMIAAGPGYELGGEAHQWAVANRLDSRVEFVGPVSATAVPGWLASLDAFLHPSLEESFGMVLLEAMAAGVPVIAGKNSGAVPVITGGNALLADVASKAGLSRALQQLLTDRNLRSQLSKAGLMWSKRFALNETAKLYLDELLLLRKHQSDLSQPAPRALEPE